MKTHTTTTSGLLRSLAIAPVLALLVISCGQEEFVEEPVQIEVIEEPMDVQNSKYVNIIEPNGSKQFYIDTQNTSGYLSIDGNTYYYVNDKGEFQVYNNYGKQIDLEKLGYEIIEVEEVEVEIQEIGIIDEEALNNEFVPQPATSPLEFIEKNKNDMAFFMDDTKINYEQALIIIKATGEKGVAMVQKRDGSKYIRIMMTDEKKKLLPPPPPPLSPLEFIEANKENLTYFINNKIVSKEAAIKTIKEIGQDKVQVLKGENDKYDIKISTTGKDTSKPDPNKVYKYLGGPS